MASFDKLYAKDESKSENGVPMEVGFNEKDEPIIFIIAEMGNAKNEKSMRRFEKALESSRRDKTRRRMVWAKILAESVLIDWKGVLDDKGEPIAPTFDNKVQALIKYDKLFTDVMEFAQNTDNFKPDDVDAAEETEKNLPNGSHGIPDTEGN